MLICIKRQLTKVLLIKKKRVKHLKLSALKLHVFLRATPFLRLTLESNQIVCINVFNVGGSIESCLTFKLFLTLDH